MSLSADLPLRDFDRESDETDSETELLIRHHNNSSSCANGYQLTNTPQQRSRHGSYSYSQHNNVHQKPSFLSQLFGVVGSTTPYLPRQSQQNLKSKQTPPLSRSAVATSALESDGQVRFRNERSRERYATAQNKTSSNITGTQTLVKHAAQAANFGRPTAKSYSLNSTNDNPAAGTSNANAGSFRYSDSLQMSNMDPQPNITTTTSPNGVSQTVIDPENGSTTVFYQKNRRKSKKRSFGNLCKLCLCG